MDKKQEEAMETKRADEILLSCEKLLQELHDILSDAALAGRADVIYLITRTVNEINRTAHERCKQVLGIDKSREN